MSYTSESGEGIFGPYPLGPDLVLHDRFYVPLWGSSGLLQNSVIQFKSVNHPGEKLFQTRHISNGLLLIRVSGDAPPWPFSFLVVLISL